MDWFSDLFARYQEQIFEQIVQPWMFSMGLADRLEDGFAASGWLIVGICQIVLMVVLIYPLECWRPVQRSTDHQAVRVDVVYTLLQRLGIFRVLMYFSLAPWLDGFFALLRQHGFATWHLDAIWPGVTDIPWVSLCIYLVAFDLLNYGIHRLQHQQNWWWRLHALHHSQRHMTMWTDSRNHILDDVLRDVIFTSVAILIGIAPGQFVAVVAFTQLCENFQHANLRMWFGPIGERLLVSPRFHRLHHSIGLGHESRGKSSLGGHNFGVLFPWWDMLFGTANFELRYDDTGIRDQVENHVDYGRGFWAQQFLGFRRLLLRE